MEGNRTQFTFYESFFKAASRIKKKADRADAYDVICAYALYGIEPDLDKLPDAVAVVFEMCKPNLIASRRKAENGKKGGERKRSESKPKQNGSKSKQTEAPANQEKEKEQDKEQDKDKEQMLYTPPVPPSEPKPEAKPEPSQEETELERLPAVLQPVMREWLEYKKQRKDTYTPVGLTALISEVLNNANRYGNGAVAQVIRTSMASNYKGIVFDRLQQQAGKGRKEMVPAWADKPSQFAQDAVKRMMEQEKNAGNDPELAERAEQLRRSLGG